MCSRFRPGPHHLFIVFLGFCCSDKEGRWVSGLRVTNPASAASSASTSHLLAHLISYFGSLLNTHLGPLRCTAGWCRRRCALRFWRASCRMSRFDRTLGCLRRSNTALSDFWRLLSHSHFYLKFLAAQNSVKAIPTTENSPCIPHFAMSLLIELKSLEFFWKESSLYVVNFYSRYPG